MKKHQYLYISLITILLCISSCNVQTNKDDNSSIYATQSNYENHIGTSSVSSPVGDSTALIFDNYEEFYLFATKGEIDNKKYYALLDTIASFTLIENSYIDIKEALNLPALPDDWSEQIMIESNNSYKYTVCSIDDKGNKQIEYYIVVEYYNNASSIDIDSIESIPNISSVDKMDSANGAFKLSTNDYTILYGKTSIGYISANLIIKNYQIRFNFGSNGVQPTQIQQKCGSTIASLFNGNIQSLSTAVSEITMNINNNINHIDK